MKNRLFISFFLASFLFAPNSMWATTVIPTTSVADVLMNLEEATSLDMRIDAGLTFMNESMVEPFSAHAYADVAWNQHGNDSVHVRGWKNDHNGFDHDDAYFVFSENEIYTSLDEIEWYQGENVFISQAEAFTGAENDVSEEEVQAFATELQAMIEAGVIEYAIETVDVIQDTHALRLAYEVDMDAMIEYFIEKEALEGDQAEELRAIYASKHLEISGNVWVDLVQAEPVFFTLQVENRIHEQSYTELTFSVLFRSLNEPIAVDVPEEAKPFEEFATDTREAAELQAAFSHFDADGDGLSNEDERTLWNTDPNRVDSDGDGYDDYTEVIHGYDPNGTGKLDSDGDGLTDYAEMTIHWSDRFDPDTDGDGYPDGVEIANGYDPNGPGRW